MIELGFAYACLSSILKKGDNYLYPLSVPPVKESEALRGTPLSRLEVCLIDNLESMHAYILAILKYKNVSNLNVKITEFISKVHKIIFDKFDLMYNVRLCACKSGNVMGEDNDYIGFSEIGNGYSINYSAYPFKNSTVYPDFLSLVF